MAAGLAGCAAPQVARTVSAPAPPAHPVPSARLGTPLEVIAAESSLVVLVYRAGPLAALGHNHLIACHCIAGTLYLPRNPLQSSFDLRIAVNQLIVDDPALRSAEHRADFPADVPRSARQGTRHNMLGAALLYAARYPRIRLRAEGLRRSSDGRPDELIAEVLAKVRGRSRSITVPVHYDIGTHRVIATGEFSLRQTDLGLTPFSLMGGALRVRNAMTVRFRLVAKEERR